MWFVVNGLFYLDSTVKGKIMHNIYGRLKKEEMWKRIWSVAEKIDRGLKNKADT